MTNLLRPFDEVAWSTYSGAESKNPLICETEGFTLILDGCHVEITLWSADFIGSMYATTLGDTRAAHLIAESLCMMTPVNRVVATHRMMEMIGRA